MSNNFYLVSIVTPVKSMAGKLDLLRKWVSDAVTLGIEIVIVHDIGDSETGTELHEIANELNSTNIKILEDYYGGPGLARNAGKNVATGKYIMFADCDDTIYPITVLRVCKEMEETQSQIAVASYQTKSISEDLLCKKRINSISARKNLAYVLNEPGIWRFIFNRTIILPMEFGKYKMGEDQVFLSQFFPSSFKILYSKEIIYEYMIGRSGQLTNSRNARISILQSVDEMALNLKAENTFGKLLFIRMQLTSLKIYPKLRYLKHLYSLNKEFSVGINEILKFVEYLALARVSRFISSLQKFRLG